MVSQFPTPVHLQVLVAPWPAALLQRPVEVDPGLWLLELADGTDLVAATIAFAERGYTGVIRVRRPRDRSRAYLAGQYRPTGPSLLEACEPLAIPERTARWVMRLAVWVDRLGQRLAVFADRRAIRRLARRMDSGDWS